MHALQEMLLLAAGLLHEAGFWIVVSLVLGGLVHEFMDTARIQAAMRKSGGSGVVAGMALGAVLPICSCGVIPLTVSFYLGGVRLAAVIAFTIATPVINPAAVVLSYALLGPQLTLAYVAFGLGAPVLVGYMTEWWGKAPLNPVASRLKSCCSPAEGAAPNAPAPALMLRLQRAMRWAFGELGPILGFYIGIGIALAAVLGVLIPAGWMSSHLGSSAPFVSLLAIALFGACLYVCAVAHIPLVAAMLAAGAGPGAAIVFLVTGAATNLPEMIALQRVLGTRTVAIYVGGVVALSIFAGWVVNLWLVDYQPMLDPMTSIELGDIASRLTPVVPSWVAFGAAIVVGVLAIWGAGQWVARSLPRFRAFLAYERR